MCVQQNVDNLLKLLNDDYVKSQLTDKEYDSTSKTLLTNKTETESNMVKGRENVSNNQP